MLVRSCPGCLRYAIGSRAWRPSPLSDSGCQAANSSDALRTRHPSECSTSSNRLSRFPPLFRCQRPAIPQHDLAFSFLSTLSSTLTAVWLSGIAQRSPIIQAPFAELLKVDRPRPAPQNHTGREQLFCAFPFRPWVLSAPLDWPSGFSLCRYSFSVFSRFLLFLLSLPAIIGHRLSLPKALLPRLDRSPFFRLSRFAPQQPLLPSLSRRFLSQPPSPFSLLIPHLFSSILDLL